MFQVLLLLRIYAIYEGNKKVLLTLLGAYTICYTATLVTATIGILQILRESLLLFSLARRLISRLSATVQYSPLIKACIPTTKPTMMAAIWGAPVRGSPIPLDPRVLIVYLRFCSSCSRRD